ncbi:hypothetical protein NMY22_g11775 [Coprinellus aureogranulatus]|nr:hypothetical protein NMY22_g11775 [Coprinellus aureogranulatus]
MPDPQGTSETMSPESTAKPTGKTVVIVGAGYAGLVIFNQLAKRLSKDVNLVLVTPRPYFVHLPAAARLVISKSEVTQRGFVDKVLWPLTSRFNEGNKRTVYGKVVGVTDGDETYVTLESGEKIEYTYLVLAPGSRWEGPLDLPDTKEETMKSLNGWFDRFEKANDIVLVGGGGIAFEIAGEFKDEWPDKNITVVHSKDLLLNETYPDYWRRQIIASLQKRGINVVLSDRLEDLEPKDGKVTTRSGKTIPADLVIPTRGPRPNTEFISSTLGSETVTSNGHVKVKPTLQLVDHPNIFAAGDIIDWDEQRSARKAVGHAGTVIQNVLTLLANPSAKSLSVYKGKPENLTLTNGRNGGTTYLGRLGLTFGDWVTKRKGSQHLYVRKIKRRMDL